MTCLDKDKFGLVDHGQNAAIALQQLLRIPKIDDGALGKIIRLIQQEVLPISSFKWVPQSGNNSGSAAAFWQVDNAKPNRIKLKEIKVSVMEQKRSQIVHELVHGLDVRYFFFNISHPPRAEKLAKRVPVLYLFPFGDIFKYNFMDVPFVNKFYLDSHRFTMEFFQGEVRNNRILKQWQRDMLMTQLNYARREDKLHAEFTANVAQCLALIYQWGFTGDEKGFLGRPRSITHVIRRMEFVLNGALESWKRYQPPPRNKWSVIQFRANDPRQPRLQGPHFAKDEWWKDLNKDKPELVIPPDRPPRMAGRRPPPRPTTRPPRRRR